MTIPEATPPFSNLEFDVAQISRLAVDQVIVDGIVDGLQKRAPIRMLTRIAFQGVHAPDPVFGDFKDALVEDFRFVDEVKQSYGYQPIIEGETEAKPHPSAIVRGSALCTEEERAVVLDRMEWYTEKLYQEMKGVDGSGVVSQREVSGALNSAGLALSYDEYGGFMAFMRSDPRFHLMHDGRVILRGLTNIDPAELEPLERISDFAPLIDEALPFIWTGPSRVFKTGALLGTLKALGIYVRSDQIEQCFEQLRLNPNITTIKEGVYKITGDVEQARPDEPPAERTMSLDAMIRHTIGKGSSRVRKPRGKRTGGWKRTVDMSQYTYPDEG